jgi:hypothetical protein
LHNATTRQKITLSHCRFSTFLTSARIHNAPQAFARSDFNVRYHFNNTASRTDEDKNRVIADFLKAKPDQSNRHVAAQIGVDHKTVAKVRAKCEAGGDIPHLDQHIGSDGKNYPANKNATPETTEIDNPVEDDPESEQANEDADAIGDEISETESDTAEEVPIKTKAETKAEIEADKIVADFCCLRTFPDNAADALAIVVDELMEAQKAGRRLLKRRSKLSKDKINKIEIITGIKLEPARKIFKKASAVKLPPDWDVS